MPRTLPPLNALRAFEAAGRHESFTKAADELGVSHSAISRHVRGLEARLGLKLFRVKSRGVALSSEGARYLVGISPVFDAIAQTTEDIAGSATGFVRVSCEPVFAVKWLVPHLNGFYERYPEIELRIDATRHLIDIAHYEADLAVRFFKDKPADEKMDLISDAPVFPFIAPKLLTEPLRNPRQLLAFTHLRDRGGGVVADWFALTDVASDAIPKPVWRMRATLSLAAAVAGQGVLFASADIVAMDVDAGRLVRCFDIPLRRGSYHVLTGEGALRRRSVRRFKEWLLEASAKLRVDG
jgi:LysR family glycine cleavage system transcriptional activator